MKHKNLVFILLILTFSCKSSDPGDCLFPFDSNFTQCNSSGYPLDSNAYFFPIETYIDSFHLVIQSCPHTINPYPYSKENFSKGYNIPLEELKDSFYTSIDTASLLHISNFLFKMDEPILYAKYLNKEIYRIIWFRSFNPAVFIQLVKSNENIYLITKILKEEIFRECYNGNFSGLNAKNKFGTYDTTAIEFSQYKEFINLLNKTKLDCMSPLGISHPIHDGATWIFESHTENGYHYVIRNSVTNKALKPVCDYLINLGPARDERKY